mgnify:CR=1 FL=1
MKINVNCTTPDSSKQVPCNPSCATCTYNCKQPVYAQVIFCRKYPRDRQALPIKRRVKKE